MEEILKQILDTLHTMDKKIDNLENRFDTLEGRFDTLENRFVTLEGRFDTLENRFDTLEGRFDTLENRFDTLEAKLDLYHTENIVADEKLLEGLKVTNDRLDFQREKLIKAEEDLFLLTRKQ